MSGVLTLSDLIQADENLKTLNLDKYYKAASDDSVEKTKQALEAKGHKVTVANTKAEALETLKKSIPHQASIMNAASTTLQEIGFVEYIKTATEWKNLHAEVFKETDWAKQAELRRQALCADYFLSSCSAVTEEGEFVVCDLTGTRTGGFAHSSKNVIVVAGSNKIVANLDAALTREKEFCLPAESARAKIAYKVPGSAINNQVIIKGANPFNPTRFHIVLIKEVLGY